MTDTQNSTPDPRQVLAQELEQWWKSGKHGFRTRHDLACLVGPNADGMLSSYFTGRIFPTLPICEKLYALTRIPSLEPHKAAEAIRQLHSERARKIHTPEVDAKISEGLRKNWEDKPRSVAYLHTSEVTAKRNQRLKTPEVKKRMRDSAKAAWASDPARRNRYAERKTQAWVDLKTELNQLRELKGKISKGRNRKDKQRKRVAELQAQGLNWPQIRDKMNKEFNETSSVGSYRGLVRDRHE